MPEQSWVEGADGSGFGLENLPFGAVALGDGPARPAVRIGEHALILEPLAEAGLLGDLPAGVLAGPVLNPFLALGRPAWSATRARLTELLRAGSPEREAAAAALVPLAQVEPRLPLAIGDYVDFYSSIEHATNVGRMFRPDAEPLLPNWRHLPVGYHGRASSVVVSGTPVRRPRGQLPPAEAGGAPRFGPTERLDIELELGFVTGPGNALGTPIADGAARDHIFGFVLVNDWSARDIQRWEYVPLGPFLGKSFATSISPWIVPLEALEPHRVAGARAGPGAAAVPAHRRGLGARHRARGRARPGRRRGDRDRRAPTPAASTGPRPQQLAHATVNGTNVRPGDLYASRHDLGRRAGHRGQPARAHLGRPRPARARRRRAARRFLEDGDTVVLRGARRRGLARRGPRAHPPVRSDGGHSGETTAALCG